MRDETTGQFLEAIVGEYALNGVSAGNPSAGEPSGNTQVVRRHAPQQPHHQSNGLIFCQVVEEDGDPENPIEPKTHPGKLRRNSDGKVTEGEIVEIERFGFIRFRPSGGRENWYSTSQWAEFRQQRPHHPFLHPAASHRQFPNRLVLRRAITVRMIFIASGTKRLPMQEMPRLKELAKKVPAAILRKSPTYSACHTIRIVPYCKSTTTYSTISGRTKAETGSRNFAQRQQRSEGAPGYGPTRPVVAQVMGD